MLLEADRLTVSARLGGRDVAVLREVSFALPAGRVLGLVGESGAGKSMIGRIIANLLPPSFRVSAGALRFQDRDLLAASAEAHRALLGDRIAAEIGADIPSMAVLGVLGHECGEFGLTPAGLVCEHVEHRKSRDIGAELLRPSELGFSDPTERIKLPSPQLPGGDGSWRGVPEERETLSCGSL